MTYELKTAIQALRLRAERARDLATTIDNRVREMEEKAGGRKDEFPVSQTDVFVWTINDIENFIRNVNFAELARLAAGLSS